MSKKNKSKNRPQASGETVKAAAATPVEKEIAAKKPEENGKEDDLKREFRNLALVIILVLALLIALYYYDQKTQILDQVTKKLFNLF
ncbi:MAG: hypothetical protein WCQ96_03900 [Patescibacteria group bacterium]